MFITRWPLTPQVPSICENTDYLLEVGSFASLHLVPDGPRLATLVLMQAPSGCVVWKGSCLGREAKRPGTRGGHREKAVRGETTRWFGPQPEGRRMGGESVHRLLRDEAKALRVPVRCESPAASTPRARKPTEPTTPETHPQQPLNKPRRGAPRMRTLAPPSPGPASPRPLRAHRLEPASQKDGWRMRPGRALAARGSPRARQLCCG